MIEAVQGQVQERQRENQERCIDTDLNGPPARGRLRPVAEPRRPAPLENEPKQEHPQEQVKQSGAEANATEEVGLPMQLGAQLVFRDFLGRPFSSHAVGWRTRRLLSYNWG